MTPTPQPKALELAYALTCAARTLLLAGQNDSVVEDMAKSSEELRRQHAEIEALKIEVERERCLSFRAQVHVLEAERDSLRDEVENLRRKLDDK